MSRILLLIIVVIWLCRGAGEATVIGGGNGAVLLCGGFILLVALLGIWSRTLARQVRGETLHRNLARFHRGLTFARSFIPAWFAVGVFGFGWGETVSKLLGPIDALPVELPGVIVGIAPPILAWIGLWWAQFPADRALREQGMLIALNEDLPLHPPPSLRSYIASNLRLQILFTLVPVGMILFLHDVASLIFHWARGNDAQQNVATGFELVVQLLSVLAVMIAAPEILRHVLKTQPLADSPLRDRLEALCSRTGLKYREILLWRTDNNIGNAAVMGLLPKVRYILLSDVLIETMTDAQIEAVFAHEIGHVKHWHMGWFGVLAVIAVLLGFGPGQLISDNLDQLNLPAWLSRNALDGFMGIVSVALFFWVFGYLSRCFERQADAFAARTIQTDEDSTAGAGTFAAALYRVAIVNNIPIAARNFTHGSIGQRIEHLRRLGDDPNHAAKFDRAMSILRAGLICALIGCVAWAATVK